MTQQAKLLDLSRSSVYYRSALTPESYLALMRCMDELHLEHPFAGARMLCDMLRAEGHRIGRKHVGTLMAKIGIEALYRRQNTSKRHTAHRILPYLLRNAAIERPNHVWAMDIAYLPMKRGFVNPVVVLDWATRRILSWRLTNSTTTDFCIEPQQEAIARYGTPEIFNTDQGSQFSDADFVAVLREHHIAISMDHKGCWRDNVVVERLWKTIKYEHVYLHAYASVSEARTQLSAYLRFYTCRRPHSSLDGRTTDTVYFNSLPQPLAA